MFSRPHDQDTDPPPHFLPSGSVDHQASFTSHISTPPVNRHPSLINHTDEKCSSKKCARVARSCWIGASLVQPSVWPPAGCTIARKIGDSDAPVTTPCSSTGASPAVSTVASSCAGGSMARSMLFATLSKLLSKAAFALIHADCRGPQRGVSGPLSAKSST